MPGSDELNAQLVMKREDGSSILTVTGPGRAATAGQADVSEARAAEIRRRLEKLGFVVTTGNRNTLSIRGTRAEFAEVFGLEADAGSAGVAAHATKIPDALADSVADVFVAVSPDFHP